MIKVFIVDDHQIFRDGLRVLLEAAEDINVVGDAESGDDAVSKLASTQPDVVLMDIQMPEENGISVVQRLKQKWPGVAVLMLTMFEDDHSVFAAMRAGASGYVLKGINHVDMLRAVRTAASGGAIFSPRIASRMIGYFDQMGSKQDEAEKLPNLGLREKEVLSLVAAGYDNGTIAEKLVVTEKTVRNYVSQIMKKLSVTDRIEAANIAREAGLT